MATIVYPHTFVPNTPARASEVNANFDAITDEVNGNIDADNLADNAVTSAKIEDGAVTNAKLGAGAVTDAKVTDVAASKVTGTISNAQLASGIDASKLTTGTLPIARIADGTVTDAKLASGIDASKLTTGTLPIARIADGAVVEAKLGTGAVTNTKLATDSVGATKIIDGSVLEAKIGTNAVTTVKVNDAAITPSKTSFFNQYSGGKLHFGRVTNNGASASISNAPAGWSASRAGTGLVDITHNLGDTNYLVFISSDTETNAAGSAYNRASTTFRVAFREIGAGGALDDKDFTFIVVEF